MISFMISVVPPKPCRIPQREHVRDCAADQETVWYRVEYGRGR